MTTLDRYKDPIYEFSSNIVFDEIVKKIIDTPEFQRLNGIKQAGITGLLSHRSYSRFEHSVGVYLLLKHLGANIEECICGLLHDIYHTNFSHTTDELFCEDGRESFHEKNKHQFFEKVCVNIQKILSEYYPKIPPSQFIDDKNINLFVTKNKSFGGDMVDYFMRDGYYENVLNYEWIQKVISKLSYVDGKIIINDRNLAIEFCEKTIFINDAVYMSPMSRGQYCIFVKILRKAIEKKIVTKDELIYGMNSDRQIYEKIIEKNSPVIIKYIEELMTMTDFSFAEQKEKDSEWKEISEKVTRKLRCLNPFMDIGGTIAETEFSLWKKMSDVVDEYRKDRKIYCRRKKK